MSSNYFSFTMPFGPHSGKPLKDIPREYLAELSNERLLLRQYHGLAPAVDHVLGSSGTSSGESELTFKEAVESRVPEGTPPFNEVIVEGVPLKDVLLLDGGLEFLKEQAKDSANKDFKRAVARISG